MTTFAESRVGVDCTLPMKIGKRHDLDPGFLKKAKQRSGGVLFHAPCQNQAGFGSRR